MDTTEARAILAEQLARYRTNSYARLRDLIDSQDVLEIRGPSGAVYQLEIEAVWDERPEGNLRVIGSIDDRGVRALVPITDDFILAPNGSFIGE